MALSKEQQEATDKFLLFLTDPIENVMVIEGYPGCGKSYLTRHLLNAVKQSNQLMNLLSLDTNKIHCTATTNKAAAVLSSMLGEPTRTIHSLMSIKVTNDFKTGKTGLKKSEHFDVKKNNLIIIDEASYIDSYLLELIEDGTHNCKILYIGDRYQLTNIHETTCPVFDQFPNKVTLRGSQRFVANSAIANLGAQFRDTIDTGVFKQIVPDGKTIIKLTGPEMQKRIDDEFTRPDRTAEDAKVVAWSNAKVTQYNKYIRSLLTPSEQLLPGERVVLNKPILDHAGATVHSTESIKIINTIKPSSYKGIDGWDVKLKGDHFEVFLPKSQIDVKHYIKSLATVAKETRDWRTYFSEKEAFTDLRPVHAATVYKAQGSTYKDVYVDLGDIGKCHQPNVVARMLHVAVTRASGRVFLYGELPVKYRG